jgi:hypothetical protein
MRETQSLWGLYSLSCLRAETTWLTIKDGLFHKSMRHSYILARFQQRKEVYAIIHFQKSKISIAKRYVLGTQTGESDYGTRTKYLVMEGG